MDVLLRVIVPGPEVVSPALPLTIAVIDRFPADLTIPSYVLKSRVVLAPEMPAFPLAAKTLPVLMVNVLELPGLDIAPQELNISELIVTVLELTAPVNFTLALAVLRSDAYSPDVKSLSPVVPLMP